MEIVNVKLIRDFLNERGQTNRWFARMLGVTEVTVCNWFANNKIPEKYSQSISVAMQIPMKYVVKS